MGWRQFNPNPQGLKTNDCTVRSICAVTGLPWRFVHRALCELSGDMADMPSTNRVWWALLRGIGFRQMHLLDRCPDCYTVSDFCRDRPNGIYILGPKEHAVASIFGDYWDSWDSGGTVPTYYFVKEEKDDDRSDGEMVSRLSGTADVPRPRIYAHGGATGASAERGACEPAGHDSDNSD